MSLLSNLLNQNNNESNKAFYKRHQAMFDSVNSAGKVWQQDIHVEAPSENGYQEISTFTAWQHNTFNEATQEFQFLQAWPRLLPSGELAWAMQMAIVSIDTDAWQIEKGRPQLQPPSYSFRYKGPVIVDSAGTLGANFHQVATSPSTTFDEFSDPVTGESILSEVVTVLTPKQKRYYSISQIVKASPPYVPYDMIIRIWFDSHSETPPQVISDAFAAYKAGVIPLRQDPNAPPGYPNIYLYVPSVDGSGPFITPTEPEVPSSKNRWFKGACFMKGGRFIITKQ